MHRAVNIVPFAFAILACAKTETPAADSAAMAAAPAALTEADIAGTWTGVAMLETSDSVVGRWTQICGGGVCKGINEGAPDTVASTYRIEGDSSIGTSSAFTEPNLKLRLVDTWVARIQDGKVVGTSVSKLADKDSVVMRTRFSGTRSVQ